MKKVLNKIKNEKVTIISLILAVASMFFVHPDKGYLSYVDTKTIFTLFFLMLVVGIIRELNIFYILGVRLIKLVDNIKYIVVILVLLCFFSSMLITNDVALITFVPFTIEIFIISKKEKELIVPIVLETIAANMGSCLTPIGNPQNIYLFSLSGLNTLDFVLFMSPVVIATCILLMFSIFILIKKSEVKINIVDAKIKKLDLVKVVASVDYFLLLTFIFLFVFIGNVSRIKSVNEFLQKIIIGKELIVSIISSQIISNVPAAILLSKFTTDYKNLLLGVNIGGLGTLIASMASLISYKFYIKTKEANAKKYLLAFTVLNITYLLVLLLLVKII